MSLDNQIISFSLNEHKTSHLKLNLVAILYFLFLVFSNSICILCFNYSSESAKMTLDAQKDITANILVKIASAKNVKTATTITGKVLEY